MDRSLKCHCGADTVKACGSCRWAVYCSKECQVADLKEHKTTCHELTLALRVNKVKNDMNHETFDKMKDLGEVVVLDAGLLGYVEGVRYTEEELLKVSLSADELAVYLYDGESFIKTYRAMDESCKKILLPILFTFKNQYMWKIMVR